MDIKSNNRQTGAGIASTSASTGASDNTSQNINTGLNSFSYADFVLLSSTISYAIAEEVSVEDLEILVTFLGMISADLALLLIKKGRLAASQAAQSTSIDTTTEETSEDVESTLVRKSRHRKKKKIKKKKVKIKQVYNKNKVKMSIIHIKFS